MSKMDALRAMREARYLEAQKGRSRPATAVRRPSADAPAPSGPMAERAPDAADEGLCGHRNMSGRTCTRERGHAQKSHRYS
jgi:hypothetical protein